MGADTPSLGQRVGHTANLFVPDRHEALGELPWDPDRAAAFITDVAADAERAYRADALWPHHPLDGDATGSPRTTLYMGAAGVMWALEHLASRGLTTLERSWREELARLVPLYRDRPETGDACPSWLVGECGLLAAAQVDALRMFELIEVNIEHPALELLWGAPGTMRGALFRARATGEARWAELWRRNARHLLDTWTYHEDAGCHVWTQQLYGETVRLLGAGHGFAGNAGALLAGIDLLEADEAALVVERACATTLATAARKDGLANWPAHVGRPRAGREEILVQWCHGAPGMLTGLAALPADPEIDALFAEAGELVYRAGPLAKGPGLCHGTAGNGSALLTLHRRTGDERWLEGARRFAMHAMTQSERARKQHGRRRYTLWTGDLGVAVHLADCIAGRAGMPTLDYL